jgi:diketogulonate reductase-like aldo/keto reductase
MMIAYRLMRSGGFIGQGWNCSEAESKPWIVPIPGTTKLHRLEENVGGAAVELAADDLRDIEEAAAGIAVQGERYTEAAQKLIDR